LRREKTPSSRAGRIAFIGGGRMAEALIKGLIKSKKIKSSGIMVSDILAERREYLKNNYGVRVTGNNQESADFGDTIILSVKPHIMKEGIRNLKVSREKLIISIAAGIPISFLQNIFIENPIVRVMPNNPALIGEGMTAIAYGSKAKDKDQAKALEIFDSVGETVEVEEGLLDAVTGLSGSGPAFVYLFIEAMIEAGENLGIKKEVARGLAIQTVLGAAETVKKTKKTTQELIGMVTSPGGTTLAGLAVLEDRGFKQALIDAITRAAARARELSQEWT